MEGRPRSSRVFIDHLLRGVDVAVASRYSKGGKYIGKKGLKYYLSKTSGIFLFYFLRVGTKDSTNMYKAYSKNF